MSKMYLIRVKFLIIRGDNGESFSDVHPEFFDKQNVIILAKDEQAANEKFFRNYVCPKCTALKSITKPEEVFVGAKLIQ